MKIYTLMENTAASPEFISSHGLSFYIETKNHKILFDMGPDGRFLENAEKLGIDISKVDTAILSHGHYDHGGGMEAFLSANPKAVIHMQKKALGAFYSHDADGTWRYIGLPPSVKTHPRLETHTGDYKLSADLQLFAGVTGRECYSPANDRLHVSMNGHYIQDLFMHEQNLLIKEGNKMVLIAGCAHNGMVNILTKAKGYAPAGIDYAIGGMHLKGAYESAEKQREFCIKMAKNLKQTDIQFYTCHCTGEDSYEILHEEMGNQMQYLAAGSVLEL